MVRFLVLLGALTSLCAAELPDFSLPGEANILEEADFGIVNGYSTVGTPYRNTLSLSSLFAPPYASSDFFVEMRLFGEKVPASAYKWLPVEVERSGVCKDIRVNSSTVLVTGRRAVILAVTLENTSSKELRIPVAVEFRGGLDYVRSWEFARPVTDKKPTEATAELGRVIRRNQSGSIVMDTDMPGMCWEPWSSHWVTELELTPGETQTHYITISVGSPSDVSQDPAGWIAKSRKEYSERIVTLFDRLPRLEASNERLVRFYNRSLLHLLLNEWRVPEFILHPYYGTGAVLGGCLGNYLWDFGEPWEIFPVYNPEASKAHIKQFLKIDLTRHFLFDPMTGGGFGPLYPVNQEKIIHLIYYYVLYTGDVAFLSEMVDGKSVLDHVLEQALYDDDLKKPVALIDYGNGNHHLELRGKYRYDYVVPDLNGRRYENYVKAATLAKIAGRDRGDLLERAAQLKTLLKDELWSAPERWYCLRTPTGGRDFRYTVQMFKLFDSPVLGKEEEAGLLSHLNDREFLSKYGLHSMSKLDPAYDQIDIDNGGGGICTPFVPQIAERLYKSGHAKEAEDLLRRVLWWGERVPYWGDSFVANQVDYRKDTPLKSELDSAAAAQAIIFGMFGIQAKLDGTVLINPQPPSFSPGIRLTGVKIRGREFDVSVNGSSYEVKAEGKVHRARIGTPIELR